MNDHAEPQPSDDPIDSTLAFPAFPPSASRNGQREALRERKRRRIVLAVLLGACLLLLGAWASRPSQRNNLDLPHVVVKVHGMS